MPLTRPLVAILACTVIAGWVAGCATEKLAATPPNGVDLTGDWKLDPNLSDDPQKLMDEPQRDQPGPRGGRGGHGGPRGGGGGLPPFSQPGGGAGGLNLGGSENLVSNGGRPPSDGEGGWSHTASESIGAPSVGGSSGGSDDDDRPAGGQGTRSRGRDSGFGHMLDAPDRMTITQNGPKLVIKTNGPNGDSSEEYTAGEKTTVSSGRGDADRTSGWRGPAFVVSTKAKKGPSKEDAYALDSEGHLIVTTQLSGGRMGKLDIKRVYDRIKPQHN